LSSINIVFVLINAVFLLGYTIQYVVQLISLFPRDADNTINCFSRIVISDIIGFVFLGIDYVLLIILIAAGPNIQIQVYLLVAIRIVRLVRVLSFWVKISAFHELRVLAYLEYKLCLMEEYDPTVYGENVGNDIGEKEADIKPVVPASTTKPQIDPLWLGADAPGGRGAGGLLRRAIKSFRRPSMEQKRVSLQNRLSQANKRASRQISRDMIAAAVNSVPADFHDAMLSPIPSSPNSVMLSPPPPVPPVRPVAPPGLPPGLLASRGLVLPPSMQVSLPTTASRSRYSSVRRPVLGQAVSLPANDPPPPIPPRTGASLAAFGITPAALQMMQGQRSAQVQQLILNTRGARARPDEPSMDEI